MMIRLISLGLCMLLVPTSGYFTFKSRIPNGDIVPHPCKVNYMWSGVGHMNPDGGGERNPFGEDFDNAGQRWTRELCRFDSDGDGKTNGEELGDPDCEWSENRVPKRVTGITHPGVCDPFGQGVCAGRDSYVDCSIESFGDSCSVIRNTDIQSVDFRFKRVEIPNTETNYYCQFFDLPVSGDYHIVADEGLIDNRNVLHHQILFGCPDDYKGSPEDNTPRACDMNEGGGSCNVLIAAWTVGLPGNCRGEMMGFRIGNKGFKKFKLEIHYNNPLLVSGYMDMSGMRIYFQPEKPGVQDMATFVVGQNHLEIPPGQSRVEFEGSCPADCTRQIMTKPMYVVSTLSHMHYMGRRQRTEVIRNGRTIKVLADDNPYSYDSPVVHKEDEPFQVLPGDEIKTTCVYSSMSSQRTVYFGDATSAEMCFAFLTVYPESAVAKLKWCVSTGPLSTCDVYFTHQPKYGCDWHRFVNISEPEMLKYYIDVERDCSLDGKCRPECKKTVEEILNHPCMGKEMNSLASKYLETYYEGAKFLGKVRSCMQHEENDEHHVDCEKHCDHSCHDDGDEDWDSPSGTPGSKSTPFLAAIFAVSTSILGLLSRN